MTETPRTAKQIGQQQFHTYSKHRLVDRTRITGDLLKRSKLPFFTAEDQKASKGKGESIENDMAFFVRLYISCQNHDRDLNEFFRHECLPALSDVGKLHIGTKSNLLVCLESVGISQFDAPAVTSLC